MTSLNRVRGLFSNYGNLQESSTSTVGSATSVSLDDGILYNSPKPNKMRRNITLGVVGVIIVLVIIIASTSSTSPEDFKAAVQNALPSSFKSGTGTNDGDKGHSSIDEDKRFELKDLFGHDLFPRKSFNGTWISEDEFMFSDYQRGLMIYDMKTKSSSPVASANILYRKYQSFDQQISADKKFIMLAIDVQPIFRRSQYANYLIFELKEDGRIGNTQTDLRPKESLMDKTEDKLFGEDEDDFFIKYAAFAPKGNGIIYIDYDNNIYYRREALGQDEKLTDDGKAPNIFNGIPDWVFEEEVIEDNKALWWSPDGEKIVWGKFNDTDVESYELTKYGDLVNLKQYPLSKQLRYPKAGTTNPKTELWMVSFANQGITKPRQIPPPNRLTDKYKEVIFTRVEWATDDFFAVHWMNRIQNETVVTLCPTAGIEDCKEIFAEESSTGWVDIKVSQLVFNPAYTPPKDRESKGSNMSFVTILPAPQSKFKYRQVVLISDLATRTYLTKMDAEVLQILAWKGNWIYYMSTKPNQSTTKHLYRVKVSDMEGQQPECLTCESHAEMSDDLHKRNCDYFSAEVSPNKTHIVLTCLGPDTPYTCVHKFDDDLTMETVLQANDRFESAKGSKVWPIIKYLEVPVSGTEQKAQVKMYLPPDFDPKQKYPTVFYAYGGPGAQEVTQKFSSPEFQTYMAGGKGFIYFVIDPRGTCCQGDDWRHAYYKGMGTAEVRSLLDAVKYLRSNMSYVDDDRCAVWGWSYGGFLSLSSLVNDDENMFKCGASVAPVVDWRLYDTYYTERVMDTPENNFQGYNNSRVVWKLDKLNEKRFFLLHGTNDDNVHFQQSILLSGELEDRNILFRQNIYTDQAHSIDDFQEHVYKSLADFFLNDCFSERLPTKK